MNKKLLTAVVVTTLSASPAVFADASLYGSLDIGIQSVSPGSGYNGQKIFVDDRQGSGGSYIGWKYNIDLGGGMSAVGQLEAGMFTDTGNLDNSNPQLFQRQIWTGLAGNFGRVTLGRQYREIFTTGAMGAYQYTNAMIGYFFMNTWTGVRESNDIKYTSPNFNGFTFAVDYDPQGSADAAQNAGSTSAQKDDSFTDFSLKYAAGPLKVGVASGSDKNSGVTTKTTIAAGQYNLGMAGTVYALYATGKDGIDLKTMSLGYKYSVGPGDIVVEYSKQTNNNVNNADATLTALAYYYHLSKQANVYAAYGSLTNDPAAQLSLPRQAINTLAAGDDPNAFTVGVRTFF